LLLLLCVMTSLHAGTVHGSVELRDSKESSVRKGKDFSGVVVWLDPANGAAPGVIPTRERMLQKDKTFTPHILPVRVGSTVDFPNFDPIFHSAFSNYNGQVFDVGLYPPGTSRTVKFTKPGIVRVFCNIHAAMSAVIVVLNTPNFDTTKKDGSFEIQNVPPGDYWLRVFHERATQGVLNEAARRVSITDAPATLNLVSISESGFLAIPHTNKYGRDYSSEPDERGGYASPRK
jgi:plastocyanin